MALYTIGFTEKSAENFFDLLKNNNVKILYDTRISTDSQLAGFAKARDLIYFLHELCGIEYVHLADLAPEKKMLKAYRDKELSWEGYEGKYLDLLVKRNVERSVPSSVFNDGCLLCSEHLPHHCHRRLAAEYLEKVKGDALSIKHLT